jgi:hypothetical protein
LIFRKGLFFESGNLIGRAIIEREVEDFLKRSERFANARSARRHPTTAKTIPFYPKRSDILSVITFLKLYAND